MNQSLGILEVMGMTTAIACVDTMVKTAYVDVYKVEKIGTGLVTIIIQGELANVKEAIEIGMEMAVNNGFLHGYKVIARPYEGIEAVFAPEEKGDQ